MKITLTIISGSGGSESKDWAEMLVRMYRMWAERNHKQITLIDEGRTEQHQSTHVMHLEGDERDLAYLLKEDGVHRLVRVSPYDNESRKHTSFTSVAVSPNENARNTKFGEWGGQIRSYVLHPYTLVKNTVQIYEAETVHAQRVLDGELELINKPDRNNPVE